MDNNNNDLINKLIIILSSRQAKRKEKRLSPEIFTMGKFLEILQEMNTSTIVIE